MDKLKELYNKYRELFLYLVFGVITTAINYLVYRFCVNLIDDKAVETVVSTIIAWIISVLFAYITNRKWVFQSRAKGFLELSAEFGAFVGARLLSGILDVFIMYLAVDIFLQNGNIVKLLSNILVIIINYLLSKFLIFRKKPDKDIAN